MATKAVLWGRDHTTLGEVIVRQITPQAALGLSRGLEPKPYRYTDPNEDVVAVVAGSDATMMVAADGHNGADAAEVAVRTVLERVGEEPPPVGIADGELVALYHEATTAILRVTQAAGFANPDSRTTLTVGLLAGRWLQWANMGDSTIAVASRDACHILAPPFTRFVGYPLSREQVDAALWRGTALLPPDAHVVVATDGFFDYAKPTAVAAVAEVCGASRDLVTAAERLIVNACEGGAGDNVAVAVARPRE